MLAMSRRTYTWLTTSLIGLSMVLIFAPMFLARWMDWLRHADFLFQLAVFPGAFIAGGIVFLIHGCLEHYADILPRKYRARGSTRLQWEAIYDVEQMYVVESILKQLARSHGFRTDDAFQFCPEDRMEDLIREFYPGRSDIDGLLQRMDLTISVTDNPTRLTLREYVDARMGQHWGMTSEQTNAMAKKPESDPARIDRQARNRLVNAIRRFMDGVLTAFAFDEEIHQIRTATTDGTVKSVIGALWFHYDDCKDHLASLSKQEWDYFQRLILLLESDAQIQHIRQRRWSLRQAVAGFGLVGFGLCVYRFGVGWHLFGFALLFGPVSILLSYWRSHSESSAAKAQFNLVPFSSTSELRAIRKSVPHFSKQRYPPGARVRQVHSRLMTAAAWLQTIVLWSFISPLILLFQTLPEKQVRHVCRQQPPTPPSRS